MDEIVLLIVGMTAVTYIPRLLPMLASGRFESLNFLKYLPVAIFAALVFPDLLIVDTHLALSGKTLAGLVAFLIALKTRNVIATMVAGVVVLYLSEFGGV
ncbi:AzlD domain-containing protein [Archaeoglobus veneficus]|uniref:Branched-chain amino acid transport n=1 Tax=Archaeoglobus veneficus (strain DSM 11195 / SNP6) TaxID=693661 RepID=F2KSH5_ARCVS|nr:AzlD domain-containing protein [Archaeoglobus veneficus]AEA46944.1 branched-chain amino acid transport [Archaeoglobus veneficus SNP6]